MKKVIKFISGLFYIIVAHGLIPLTWLNYRQQLWLGRRLGLLLLRFDKRSRRIAEINIDIAFSTWSANEKKQLLQETFIAVGISSLEMLSLVYPRKKHLLARLRSVHGVEAIQQTVAEGHSVVLLFPHLISVYFAGYLLGNATPLSFAIQYNPPRNKVIEAFMQKRIERTAFPVFTRHHLQRMITYLREAPNILWYSPDLDLGRKRSVFIDFFGFPAATGTITHSIVTKTQAKTFIIAFYRDAEGLYDIELQPLPGFGEHSIEEDLTVLNQRIEDIVKKQPAQYLWQYKRYNTRPMGEEKLYRL